MARTIEDLNVKELLEDLEYWVNYANVQSPPFVDKTFKIIREYIKWIRIRLNIKTGEEEDNG